MKTEQIDRAVKDAKDAGLWLIPDKPVSVATIEQCEQKLRLKLPASYRHFLLHYGMAVLPGIELLGLVDGDLEARNHLNTFRLSKEYHASQELPRNYIIVREFSDGCFACLEMLETETTEARVLLWDVYELPERQVRSPHALAGSFGEYLQLCIDEARSYA